MTGPLRELLSGLASAAKLPLESLLRLETGCGTTFVAQDGSLMSLLRIDGLKDLCDDDRLAELALALQSRLAPYLSGPGHALQMWFTRDPDLSDALVQSLIAPTRIVARGLGLELDDLFEERSALLPRFVVHEATYVALWTRPSALTEIERKRALEESRPPRGWPPARLGQYLFGAARQLAVRHEAMVSTLLVDLKDAGVRAVRLDVADALVAIRGSFQPDALICDWEPWMPGSAPEDAARRRPPWPRLPALPGDVSHLLWPRIAEQILPNDAETVGRSLVRLGPLLFGAVDMTMGPQDILPFRTLIRRIREMTEFPWRASFLLEGGGLRGLALKSFLAAIAGFSNSENRYLREAVKVLKEHQLQGGVVVRLRASFCTWGPAERRQLVEERLSRLQRAVEAWGYCGASSACGDPLEGMMSSALAVAVASTAPAGAAPIEDVLYMLPWDRDASPFAEGPVLLRTEDGRVWPYRPGSTQEDTAIDIVYAPPGKGKSVFLNTVSLGFCLSPAATAGVGGLMLPRIAIIDIGPSSAGLISLLQEALPPERRHEAVYRRLRMTRDCAINPFDTPLGFRRPLALDRGFLVNFLCLLGTDPGRETPPAGFADLCGMVVDEAYETFSDGARSSRPKPWIEGECPEIDRVLAREGLIPSEETPWWTIVDRLFERGLVREAMLAQRHAVPKLDDLPAIANLPKVADLFGRTPTESGEPLLALFQRTMAAALREYPILSQPTQFDLGEARVVALDLNDAAPKGGGQAAKQTAIAYMLARFVLARDFYLNPGDLDLCPIRYRDWHGLRIQRLRETPKRLVMDEFHRTEGIRVVRDQVKIDMREGRKWGVQIALASQLLRDFDQDMLSLATGCWIMGVANERDAQDAAATFGLSEAGRQALRKLTGPRAGGSPLLAVLQLKDGKHEHLLFNTLGPVEIWAFSTTPDDVALRNRLYAALGPAEARRRLARRFPSGSARPTIERRQQDLLNNGGVLSEEATSGIVAALAEELIAAG